MAATPTGTVTFLFTDVEGSTALWERDEEAMAEALERHNRLIGEAIAAHGGYVFATGGDSLAVAFERADAALAAAVDAQTSLARGQEHSLELRVRMGLHTGEAHERDGFYLGPAVNRAARVADAANGGQILCTATTADVAGDPHDAPVVDLGHHVLRDVVEPVRLFRVLHPSVGDDRPPRTGAYQVGNLPAAVQPVIGRADAIEVVRSALTTHRVVTLTGVGGMGKTTLALEVARAERSRWRDGVWLARLESGKYDDVPELLAGVFGVSSRGRDDTTGLIAALRPRETLLVLDNCEHVVSAVAPLVQDIIAACPGLRVLATSRLPLGVVGEKLFRVPALTLGIEGTAAELFRRRSSEIGTVLEQHEERDIAAICRKLDGLPLAIELAAARTASMRPREVVERLNDMMAILTRGRSHGEERHRTLSAAIEWSFHSIDEWVQRLAAQLSVFSDAFDLDAAAAICDAPDHVLDGIETLIETSLLEVVGDSGSRRFRMLEPIRQFAAPKRNDETDERHALHFADLMADVDEQWRGGDDQGAWPVAQRELRNIHQAFNWMCATERIDEAQRIAVAGWGPVVCHFDYLPHTDWAPRSLALDPDHVGPWTASAYAVATWGALANGDLDAAAELVQQGRDAVGRGSRDDGLLVYAARHAAIHGAHVALDPDHLTTMANRAQQSDDRFTVALVGSMVFDPRAEGVLSNPSLIERARTAARELGNLVLVSFVAGADSHHRVSDPRGTLEDLWEHAQRTHSFVVRNSTAHVLGAYEVHHGNVADGLLLLRTAARDWAYRGDIRAGAVLRSMAAGFVRAGDQETARAVLDAIGTQPGRHIGRLDKADDQVLGAVTTQMPRSAPLDLGAAVDLACERAEAMASSPPTADDAETIGLTDRQLEVAELVARGLPNKDIAHRLDISRYTVETHVRNILERIDATSRTQIATWIVQRPQPGSLTPTEPPRVGTN